MKNYKYYILEKGNNSVSGVVSDDGDTIEYEALMIKAIKDEFSGQMLDQLVPYHESPVRSVPKSDLLKAFEHVEITKEYWTAWEHAAGRKRKAVAPSSEA